jgi:hypothetical protein
VSVADLSEYAHSVQPRFSIQPVKGSRFNPGGQKVLLPSHNDLVFLRSDLHHIVGLQRSDAESVALADREPVSAEVLADLLSLLCQNLSCLRSPSLSLFKEETVIISRNKTDLLALRSKTVAASFFGELTLLRVI